MEKEIKSIYKVKTADDAIDQLFCPSSEMDQLLDVGYQSNVKLLKKILYEKVPSFAENLVKQQKSDRPILSLVTSLYKGDAYIEGFLENTSSQVGFENYELIILNCDSPGNEEKIILKYCARYANIVYKRLDKDPGLYQAWNLGIQMAKGEFISNANLDDRRSLAYYVLMLDWMRSNNIDVGASLFWTCRQLPELSMDEDAIVWYKDYPAYPSYFDFFKLDSTGTNMVDQCILGPMPIWRKALHSRMGYFDEKNFGPSSDYAMWCALKVAGYNFGLYRVPLVYYLRVADSYARRVNVDEFNRKIIETNFISYVTR